MLEIIYATRVQNFNNSLVETIDNITKHTHENRYAVEGWKTNAGHLLNRKFIIDCAVEYDSYYSGLRANHYQADRLNDLIKVICHLTGTAYENYYQFHLFFQNKRQPNVWYDWIFFRVKGFKKGTLHLVFEEEKIWEMVNRKYAEIKGQVLPEKI